MTSKNLRRTLAPSPPALVFLLLAGMIPILMQKPLLNSDGDLARHLGHGRYMLEQGRLIGADPFSFTRPGARFIGFEYGSQLLYALAERVGGLPAVAMLAGLLIALSYMLVTRFLLSRGVEPLLACLSVALSIVLGIGHWSARPHLFTFVAAVVLLHLLERPPRQPGWAAALLFLFWANLHGGFIYGWILIAIYLLGSLGELAWGQPKAAWRARVHSYSWMLTGAIFATLFNPHGLELHRHLLEFFATPYLMDNTAEFVSPNFHEAGAKVFLALLGVILIALTLHRPRPTLPHLVLVCVSTAFALLAVRNVPLFGLTALPVLVLHLDQSWRRLPDPGGIRGRFEATAGTTSTLPWVMAAVALCTALALTGGQVGAYQLIRKEFDASVFPVAAVTQARQQQLKGRLFHEFPWGGYLVHAWPEQKIFIDGGTDFFGEAIFREYVDVKRMSPGWRDRLRKRDISLVLLERNTPLAHELARDGGWLLWYCDSLAVLFRRSETTHTIIPAAADSVERALDACARHPSRRLGGDQ
jgi:hypothetical protein